MPDTSWRTQLRAPPQVTTPAAQAASSNYGEGIVNEWQINHNWDGGIDETECGPPTNPGNPKGRDCTKDQIHYFDHVVLGSVL
jgi:hypothetical protein